MDRPSFAAAPGITLATEELLALCDAVGVAPPKSIVGSTAITDTELVVARHVLVARKLAVPHRGSLVVHPALAGLIEALATPTVVVRVEVDERGSGPGEPFVLLADEAVVIEHRLSPSLGLHHLGVVDPDCVVGNVIAAAGLVGAPPAAVPGFAVKAGALRAAMASLERGVVAEALDALVAGGAPARPAKAFAAAVAARHRTVVVAVLWRDGGTTTRTTTSWVDGGQLGLWRLATPEHATTAVVEPATSARLLVEISNALPQRLAARPLRQVAGANVEVSARS